MPPKSAVARRKRREQEDLKHLLLVCGDAVVTAVWVLISCTFAEVGIDLSLIGLSSSSRPLCSHARFSMSHEHSHAALVVSVHHFCNNFDITTS